MRGTRIALLVLVAAPFAAEGLVRLRAYARYGPYLDVYELQETDPVTGLARMKPDLDVVFAARSRIGTDSRGFRSPEVTVPKPPGTLRLAFLGGSTTFCGQVPTNAETWPALVTAALAEELAPLAVDHVNAGITGYTVLDSTRALRERVAPVDPDVVVVYHATNDLAVDTNGPARAAGLYTEPERSRLEEVSLLWHLIRKNRHVLTAVDVGASEEGKLEVDFAPLAAAFGERLEALVAEAEETAEVVVLVAFSTRFRADQPREEQLRALTQSFTFMPYLTPEATLRGYAAYNDAIGAVAARTGAVLVGDPNGIPGDDVHFEDSVHLTEAGCRAMADRVVAALRSSPAFAGLVRTVD